MSFPSQPAAARAASLASALRLLALAVLVILGAAPVRAETGLEAVVPSEDANPYVIGSEAFLTAHPDIRWRTAGLEAYGERRYERAFSYFLRAARYADKPSQAMLADMLWKGDGVAQDRTRAYAWMDLASERGYGDFIRLREIYWAGLTDAERKAALEVGREMFDEFRDSVAKPRLEAKLRKGRRNVTGSRLGAVGFVDFEIPGPGGLAMRIDAEEYFDDRYWEPDKYWDWQDFAWRAPRTGRVEVGPFEALGEPAAEPPPAAVEEPEKD
jgi:hypothetical protein